MLDQQKCVFNFTQFSEADIHRQIFVFLDRNMKNLLKICASAFVW